VIASHCKAGIKLRDSIEVFTGEGKMRKAVDPNVQYCADLKALREQELMLANMLEFQAEITTFTESMNFH
jgi:hypothetical protein